MLRSTLGAFLPPCRPACSAASASPSASPSASAASCLRLKDLGQEVLEEEPRDKPEIRTSRTRSSKYNNYNSRRLAAKRGNCSSVAETTSTSAAAAATTLPSSDLSPLSSSSLSAPGSMWQEAMRRKRHLLDHTGESGGAGGVRGGGAGGGGRGERGGRRGRRNRSPDWLYESYYCMSQQHPLIVFLLLIVMGACLALLTVFFASGLVSYCTVCIDTITHMKLQK